MLIKSDSARRIFGLIFEVIILAFIVSYSWLDIQYGAPDVKSELAYKAISAEPIVLRDNSSAERLKSSISTIQDILVPKFSLDLSDIRAGSAVPLFSCLFRQNTFSACISINAP